MTSLLNQKTPNKISFRSLEGNKNWKILNSWSDIKFHFDFFLNVKYRLFDIIFLFDLLKVKLNKTYFNFLKTISAFEMFVSQQDTKNMCKINKNLTE